MGPLKIIAGFRSNPGLGPCSRRVTDKPMFSFFVASNHKIFPLLLSQNMFSQRPPVKSILNLNYKAEEGKALIS